MGDFSNFYQQGGVFMHVLSLEAAIAVTAVILHSRARRMGAEHSRYLRFANHVVAIAIATGLLGSLHGLIEMCGMLSMVAPDKFLAAAARASGIVVVPLAWSLTVAIPLWAAIAVQRARQPAPTRQASAG